MLELVPLFWMLVVWVLPIVLIWWMVRTLNSIRVDVRRIADGLTSDPAPRSHAADHAPK